MDRTRIRTTAGVLAVCFMALISAYAQGDKVKVKGLITTRTGETIVLKTTDGTALNVVLDDDTKRQQPKGLIGARKTQMSAAVLVPGLRVSVDGTSQGPTHILAK